MSTAMTRPADGLLTVFKVEHPEGKAITYDRDALCKKLGVDDPGRLIVETQGYHGLVMVYPHNPLAQVRAVTREDLIMDRHGRYTAGFYHNGQPVRKRLFDPSTGSAQRFVLIGTTGAGKSKTLQLQLIAEKINGICTWLADLKEGQSVPEAAGNVDWRVTSLEGAVLMLMAGVEVAKARMRRYSALGRNAFVLGDDPLLHIHIDEVNRLLERGSPYRALATRLIKELSRTGRSVGVGIGLAAQAFHLEELGGSDTLRAMMKTGEVTLLRWTSSMMRQLVADGILQIGSQLLPIPETLAPTVLRSPFDVAGDDSDVPGTQGMAYYVSGPRPTSLMRHLRVGSIAPLPGLDPEILALYGPEEPRRLEEASLQALDGDGIEYMAYALRNDDGAMAALCAQFADAVRTSKTKAGRGPTAPADADADDHANDDHNSEDGEDDGGGDATLPPASLPERILAVLKAATAPMSAAAICEAVNADGGRQVGLGAVRNVLTRLSAPENGPVTRPGHGLYALA
ncbi:major plasmid transfer protein, traa [Planobispora rosea]|uniref:Major plasmid transfer protein, traa n=1 Tax=Planobispora rosea TaxID=35762 RepID=A0A8J3S5M8_PLARO|nr:transfer protein [Planobispora rosea]GGS84538.1 major plasmid transfer protein, traa [Planobispora rosea]GIH86406.1 major plasmid transfer protein, traa [Planobispora rosea]